MKALNAVARFCYDFVVGDDWKIATAVVTALLLAAVLAATGASDAVIAVATTVALVTGFTTAVVVDVRRRWCPVRRRIRGRVSAWR